MKKVLIVIGGIAAVLVVVAVVFAILVAMQPADFRVERTATIAAEPSAVFEQVNDFHKWEAWSPWEKLDPDLKRTFEGPPAGKGAIYKWSGNDKVGEGQMTLTESRPGESIKIELGFVRPMQDTSDVIFKFKPDGKNTVVTWRMEGTNKDFISKAFCYCMNMDKMVGGDFEKGLASLKEVVERKPKE